MDAWGAVRSTSRSSRALAGCKDRSLLGVAGLCAALWALLLTNALDKGGPAAGSTIGAWPIGSSMPAAPGELEAAVQIASIDPETLTAAVGLTLRGLPNTAASGGSAVLQLTLGGLAARFPVGGQNGSSSAVTVQMAAALEEVIGARLRPFDAYSLGLSPASAVLTSCSSSSTGADDSSSGSDSSSDDDDVSRRSCLSVAMPLRLEVDTRTAPGFKVAVRSGGPGSSGGAWAREGGADLALVTRATSQRVLRLVSLMLQWMVTAYAIAWCTVAVLGHVLLARCMSRTHFPLA